MRDVKIRWDEVRASEDWEYTPDLHPWANVDCIVEVLSGPGIDGMYEVRLSDGEVSGIFYFYLSELEAV